jgi:hypothetical protein
MKYSIMALMFLSVQISLEAEEQTPSASADSGVVIFSLVRADSH